MRREAQRRLIEALVVDDEAASLRIHGGAVLRAPGFRLAGTADLVLLGEVSMEMEYRRAGRPLHRFRILE